MRVWLPQSNDNAIGGVGQVIAAQRRHLPTCGVHLADDPKQADIIAVHVTPQHTLPRIDVHHMHGLHYDIDGTGDQDINRKLIHTIREARAHTLPSEWSAMALRRDLRLRPNIIPNGIDCDVWQPDTPQSYALWNKTRKSRICDPQPAYEMAMQGVPIMSTFVPDKASSLHNLKVTGKLPFQQMKQAIQSAGVYIATTREVMAVGVLEALASGVPVLGYLGSGTEEVIQHQVTGYLVPEGDIDGLVDGYYWLMQHRNEMSVNCIEAAQAYDWQAIIPRYAALYERVLYERLHAPTGVSVIITSYNYGRYLPQSIESCLKQKQQPAEIIVVDDGSTDDTRAVAQRYPVRYVYQENQGAGAARNAGIAIATQPYIICLDADDWLDPAYISTLYPVLHGNRQLGAVYSGITWHREDGIVRATHMLPFDWERHVKGNIMHCAAMFRREMWERGGGYTATSMRGEDYEFWLRGLSIGYDAQRATQEPLFHYRSHGHNKSKQHDYNGVNTWLPWAHDGQYPAGVAAKTQPMVRSYRSPEISVIIPVGPGHAEALPTVLECLLGQSFRDWEAIVIDDTREGIPAYLLRPYPFARVVRISGGIGAGAARNIGIDQARAPLCLFLDADDYLIPSGLQAFYGAYHASDASYIYSDWFTWHDGELCEKACHEYSQQAWLDHGVHAVTVLMRTTDARRIRFDETLPAWEDWVFFADCAVNGVCGERIALPLLGYMPDKGHRRRYAEQHKHELKRMIDQRYTAYKTGEKEIMGCCGGGKKKNIQQVVQREPVEQAATTDSTYVRMEYIGKQSGEVTYRGSHGHTYRASKQAARRFVDVHRDDVAKLEGTRKFQRVARGSNTPARRQAAVVPPPRPMLKPEPVQETAPEPDVAPEPEHVGPSYTEELDNHDDTDAPSYEPRRRKRGRPRRND